MTLWLVVFLLLAVLSPLVWLLPSKGQRGRMELRMQARRMGLAMQLARQEWPHWLPVEPPASCAQFHRARRRGAEGAWTYWQVAPGQWVNQWREPLEDPVLLGCFAGLPADVYKIETTPQMVALYWGERGTAEDLQRIAEVLRAID